MQIVSVRLLGKPTPVLMRPRLGSTIAEIVGIRLSPCSAFVLNRHLIGDAVSLGVSDCFLLAVEGQFDLPAHIA